MAEEMVTPRDLEAVRTELKADMHRVELSLADFRTEVAKELGQVRSEVGGARTELVGMLGQLGNRLTAVETTSQYTQVAMQELRSEMRQLRTTVTRQMWTMITVITGAIVVGLVKLVFFPGGTP